MNRFRDNAIRAAAAICMLFGAEVGLACSCRPFDLRGELDRASIVFIATIVEAKLGAPLGSNYAPREHAVVAKFRIDEVFKGRAEDVTVLKAAVTLRDDRGAMTAVSSCAIGDAFPIGAQYLVFASAAGEVGVGQCTPTQPLRGDRQKVLENLRHWRRESRD